MEPVENKTEEGVGLSDDERALQHLRQVIEQLRPTWGDRRPLITTHRSPDPDALGAMVGLEALLREAFGLDPLIAATGRIFRAENLAMVRELSLDFTDYAELEPGRHAGIFLCDTQPGFGHTSLPDLPVVAVFDHHRPLPPEKRLGDPPHYDVRTTVGATSAMVYGYLRDAGVAMDPRTATAICCGVRFDTGDLSSSSNELDAEAFHESFRRADRAMLARINRPVLPQDYYRELHHSLDCARRHGPLVHGLLGRVRNPETVAEMADFFLRMDGCRWSFVGGAFEDKYHLSIRTDIEYGEAYPLMEKILDGAGTFGGRGPVAGAQIPLEPGEDIERLEGRLRQRALDLVDPDQVRQADSRDGNRLTRLT